MDKSNNNPTTVGGVTFGAVPTSDPFASIGTPFTQENPTTPETTPETETSHTMENQPSSETTPKTPSDDPIIPEASTLNVPIVSPTSFDSSNTVRPVVKDPSLPNIPQPITPEKPSKFKVPETTDRTLKKFTTMSVVFGILAAIFLIAGVVGLVFGLTQADQLATTQAKLDNATKIIRAVEETTGVASITQPEDVPVYKATTGYIYISEWNIKIKIPDNLEYVSYILNQNYRPSICFNAVQKGVQYFPDFANVVLNPGRMGCLTRIATTEGSFDAATGLSFGTLVFTNKDFNYFYTGSTDYSNPETDAANLGLEHTAVQIIKNMLTDNIEPYE